MKQLTQSQKSYRDKFKDPKWQRKRLLIMERDDFQCQICFDKASPLNVHHRYYEFGKDPWDYQDEALVTLCEYCHEAESEMIKQASQQLVIEFRKRFFSHSIGRIAAALSESTFLHQPDVLACAMSRIFSNESIQRSLIDGYFRSLSITSDASPIADILPDVLTNIISRSENG